jgi:single-strand DNA-binding protein
VTIWNERHTERVMQHIRTGASVVVKGDLYVNPWITRENEPQSGVHIDAESIALNLVRVEQVVFQARQRRDGEAVEADPPPNAGAGSAATAQGSWNAASRASCCAATGTLRNGAT